MKDPRFLLAIGGTIIGVVGGTIAAVSGAPLPGVIAAAGAIGAGLATLLPSDDSTGSEDRPSSGRSVGGRPQSASFTGFAPPPGAPPEGSDQPSAPDSIIATAPPAPDVKPRKPAPSAAGSVPLLIDPDTGLFSEDYFNIAIDARLAAARRHLRPVGLVLLEVVEGLRINRVRPADPAMVAHAVKTTLREADTACHRPDGRFALLLEDTPENGAIWTVERIRRQLVEADASLTVRAGVACYPAHAFDSPSLLDAAGHALTAAREWRQDRIEVATGD